MTEQEKIDLVVSAILEARKKYPVNCIKLELTKENKLNLCKELRLLFYY